jgi:uroporphyrinogen decarboxylase
VGKKCGVYIVCHSCGAIRPIIVDLIEVGVNVLNPIKRNCPGLHSLESRKEFSSDLVFMRGLTRRMFRPMAQSIKYAKRRSNCLKE